MHMGHCCSRKLQYFSGVCSSNYTLHKHPWVFRSVQEFYFCSSQPRHSPAFLLANVSAAVLLFTLAAERLLPFVAVAAASHFCLAAVTGLLSVSRVCFFTVGETAATLTGRLGTAPPVDGLAAGAAAGFFAGVVLAE